MTYKLDQVILRAALSAARELVQQGLDAEDAARQATPGAWEDYRGYVLGALLTGGEGITLTDGDLRLTDDHREGLAIFRAVERVQCYGNGLPTYAASFSRAYGCTGWIGPGEAFLAERTEVDFPQVVRSYCAYCARRFFPDDVA